MTSISSTTLDNLAAKTDASSTKASQTYNQFLNLLTTQLQHQDPLDPMDSSQFTSQLVSFSQVEQGILTNQKLDSLLTQTSSNQMGQSLAYIGNDVYYKGAAVYSDGNSEIKIGYAIDGDAKTATLRVRDENQNIIRTIDVPAGTTSGSIAWDGKDDEGNVVEAKNYAISIDALTKDGTHLSTYTAVPGHIEGIETVDGVLYLALKGGGRVDATQALSISQPDDPNVVPDTTT